MIYQLLIIGIILACIWWCIEYYRHFNGVWSIPTLKLVFPFIGHLYLLTTPQNAYWDLHKYTMTVGKAKFIRGVVGLYFGINVIDPVILENLLSNTNAINKAQLYKMSHRWVGTGLLTSDAEKWRLRRKLLTPAYHFKILEQFIDIFDKNGKILVKKLLTEVGKPRTDVHPFVTLCTLDTICETAMGTSINAQDNSRSEYVVAIQKLANLLLNRGISVLKQSQFYYRFTQDYREETKNLKIVHGHTMSVIKSRRNELLQRRRREVQSNDVIGYKEKIPFLDVLLQATLDGAPLTDLDIREEVDTFMFEGHDTTSSAISFCLYSIAQYSGIQAKLVEEQRAIFGTKPDRETTYQDLQEMKYLEMVIKETLRLYPSVPLFGRVVSEDFTFENYRFKKGTELAIMVYSLHRNPEIYPDPEVFNPERFTAEEQAKRHPYAYLPFSAGFRNCVGQKFAMLEMKATLGMLLRKLVFHKAPDSELKLKSGLILTSSNGINVRITERLW